MKVERVGTLLSFVENKKNYYACFPYVIQSCIIIQELKRQLWESGEICDNESLMISERVNKAKCNAIETHKAFVTKTLRQNKNHTVESVVSSIYNVIFE